MYNKIDCSILDLFTCVDSKVLIKYSEINDFKIIEKVWSIFVEKPFFLYNVKYQFMKITLSNPYFD